MDPRIFVVIGIVTSSTIISSYYHFANQKGLPVGNFFLPKKGVNFKFFSMITGLYFIVAGGIDFGFHFLFIIPFAGFVIAFFLTSILGKHVQIIGLVGFVSLVLANILMQVEIVNVK